MAAQPAQRTDKENLSAIFKVVVEKQASGTGFLVHDQQHILTAYHVVKNAPQGKVLVMDTELGVAYPATTQYTIEKRDIALLRLDEPMKDVKPFVLSRQALQSGQQIRTFGFPANFGNHWYLGEVAGDLKNGKSDILFKTQFPDSLKGLSGGPVFLLDDAACTIAGVIVEQNLDNPQMGIIVPSDGFYEEISRVLRLEEAREDIPWCFVILSEMEEVTPQPDRLREAIYKATVLLIKEKASRKEDIGERREHIHYAKATDLVASPEAYEKAVGKLCQAKIAIFDVTHFEPAVMLLLGVRSVVRRGITIASHGGKFVVGEAMEFPFNIKEVNIISHSKAQQSQKTRKPEQLISGEIREGESQLKTMPQYLDLPTFDTIRNLPIGSREPDAKNVLALCPYSRTYQETNWGLISNYMETFLPQDALAFRNMDGNSPRLISHTIYQHIRRKILCIVDWTEWRPNVFFEFGVRLAVTSTRRFTVTVIEDKYKRLVEEIARQHDALEKDKTLLDGLVGEVFPEKSGIVLAADVRERYLRVARQCVALLKLFEPIEYNCSSEDPESDQFKRSAFEDMVYYYQHVELEEMPLSDRKGLAPYFTYQIIRELIDPGEEALCTPVYLELLNTARLFDVDPTDGRKAILYPENEALKRSVEAGITQRLLAAWYFIRSEFPDPEIVSDAELLNHAWDVSSDLRKHLENDESRTDLAEKVDVFIRYLEPYLQAAKGKQL
jgi:hypothetical protein